MKKSKFLLTNLTIIFLLLFFSSFVFSGWFYSDYEFRKNITFNTDNVYFDIPFKVVLDNNNFDFSNISSVSQFRFTYLNKSNNSEVPLKFFVYKDNIPSKVVFYVKTPVLDNNTTVFLYFSDNSSNKSIVNDSSIFSYYESFTDGVIDDDNFKIYSNNYTLNSDGLRLNSGYTRLNSPLNFSINDDYFVETVFSKVDSSYTSYPGFFISSSPYTASSNANSDFTVLNTFSSDTVYLYVGSGKTNNYDLASGQVLSYISQNTFYTLKNSVNNSNISIFLDDVNLKSYNPEFKNFSDWWNTNYSFRIPFNISSNNNFSGVVNFTFDLSTFSGFKSDCSDFKIVSKNGVLKRAFLDFCNNVGNTTFYFYDNFSIGDNEYYLYFGNTNDNDFLDDESIFSYYTSFEGSNSEWTNYSSGNLYKDNSRSKIGNFSFHKVDNNDPNGGYNNLNFSFDRGYILSFYVNRNSAYTGGQADRIGVIDDNGNGYGFVYSHGVGVQIDVRNNYNGNNIDVGSPQEFVDSWYKAELYFNGNDVYVNYFSPENNLLGSYKITDNSYSLFNHIYIFGGNDYWVDSIKLYKNNNYDFKKGNVEKYYTIKDIKYFYMGGFTASINNNPSLDVGDVLYKYVLVSKNYYADIVLSPSEYIGGEYKELYFKVLDEDVNVFLNNFTLTFIPKNSVVNSVFNVSSGDKVYVLLNSYDDFNSSEVYTVKVEREGYVSKSFVVNMSSYSNGDDVVFNISRISVSSGGGGGSSSFIDDGYYSNNDNKTVYVGRFTVYPFISRSLDYKYFFPENTSFGSEFVFKINFEKSSSISAYSHFSNREKEFKYFYEGGDFFVLRLLFNVVDKDINSGVYPLYVDVYKDGEYFETLKFNIVVKNNFFSFLNTLDGYELFRFSILGEEFKVSLLDFFIGIVLFGFLMFVFNAFLGGVYNFNFKFKTR